MTSTRQISSGPPQTRQFTTSKLGHAPGECEDAIGINLVALRFVVADGATEAFDSGRWARQLAAGWVERSELLESETFWEWIGQQGTLLTQAWSDIQLSWYAEEKARAGSFAAFVGIELDLAASVWRGIALGDSCLFHFRNNQLLASLPDVTENSFTSNPVLAPSLTALQTNALKSVVSRSGELIREDVLILCSDALAAWLTEKSEYAEIIKFVFKANDQQLLDFLNNERSSGRLKDDDLSLIAIEI